jgi:putative intracellular protease/amidase
MFYRVIEEGFTPVIAGKQKRGNRKVASVASIKDDVIAAGGEYIDSPVIENDNLISSRHLGDLPDFVLTLINALKIEFFPRLLLA